MGMSDTLLKVFHTLVARWAILPRVTVSSLSLLPMDFGPELWIKQFRI
jgi:hypothetical protein